MFSLIGSTRRTIDRNLGRCARCTRRALHAAVVLGALATLAGAGIENATLAMVLFALAGAGLMLWLAHLAAFGTRVVLAARGKQDTAAADGHVSGRRAVLPVFVRAVAAAAIATAVPRLASAQVMGCHCTNGCAWFCGFNCGYAFQRVVAMAPGCGAPACAPAFC